MMLLTNENEFEKEFIRLCTKYKSFYWATAWAGVNSNPFNQLKISKNKIMQVVVGIHFYQTHPDFIHEFITNNKVRYVLQPSGTFHPKMYLFENNPDDWEILIGSGNFTAGAFGDNAEAVVLITSGDNNATSVYKNARTFIASHWNTAEIFSETGLEKYRLTWKNQQPKIKSLSGIYGGVTGRTKPIHQSAVITMTWSAFIKRVKEEKGHGVNKRLGVIKFAGDLLRSIDHFSDLADEERKFIAGMPNRMNVKVSEDWGYFGSMMGNGVFKKKIIENNKNISLALDQIPSSGQITRIHYDRFVDYYQQSFSGTRLENANNTGSASRLLAMKRPDTFICYDSQNKEQLNIEFGIRQKIMDYNNYWEDIILRVYDSEWWQHPAPKDETERQVSEARAAFLDSLYYDDSHLSG